MTKTYIILFSIILFVFSSYADDYAAEIPTSQGNEATYEDTYAPTSQGNEDTYADTQATYAPTSQGNEDTYADTQATYAPTSQGNEDTYAAPSSEGMEDTYEATQATYAPTSQGNEATYEDTYAPTSQGNEDTYADTQATYAPTSQGNEATYEDTYADTQATYAPTSQGNEATYEDTQNTYAPEATYAATQATYATEATYEDTQNTYAPEATYATEEEEEQCDCPASVTQGNEANNTYACAENLQQYGQATYADDYSTQGSYDSENRCNCLVHDEKAQDVLNFWNATFPDSILLPVIGFPSNNGGVMVLTHSMGGDYMKINGLQSLSPLSNYALFSSECSNGHYLNLYEVMLPDYPGKCGERSTVQLYINELERQGLDVAGFHFHWTGASANCASVLAIHHQNIGLDPMEFSCRTIKALNVAMNAISKSQEYDDMSKDY